MIIATASQKGGAGKTTVTIALAGAAHAAGCRVVILDLDPQASATVWADARQAEWPHVEPVQPARLARAVEQARQVADLILIDTAPHVEAPALAAARAADLVIVPCRPAYLDLMAIRATVDMVALAGKRPVLIINAARPNASRRTKDATDALLTYSADICPAVICDRTDFADAITAGLTTHEYNAEGKAAAEAAAVYTWLRQHVKMPA